ncbi:hypothetical protein JYG34_10240 [Pseudomonas entomophila]|uniref:hypothetical protein n=1 Tax=Pseudomonas entomophila TaxID=312306 RepID=UPI001BCEAB12|nr:hypothetical protein [Pseudomonas entomophila]QVM93364.1 hypothetical protein JYG34_10240 [Pseudomonas entomophila]
MQRIVSIALLATASLAQITHGDESMHSTDIELAATSPCIRGDTVTPADNRPVGYVGNIAPIQCPEGTFLTGAGHCQPSFEFD